MNTLSALRIAEETPQGVLIAIGTTEELERKACSNAPKDTKNLFFLVDQGHPQSN